MGKNFRRLFASALLLLSLAASANGQSRTPHARNGEMAFRMETLTKTVAYLTDTLCAGRRTGTPGGLRAATWISGRFREAGLQPFADKGDSYLLPFTTSNGASAYNIAGMIPGRSDKWVVVGAHFDHLGTLDGTMYPGADKNASGVAALLSLSDMFKKMRDLGKIYNKGLIFVAFDGKEMNLAGSQAFVSDLSGGRLISPASGQPIRPADISLMVNLDQLGSTLSPAESGREDYLIALTGGTGTSHLALLKAINDHENLTLELLPDYYGSADFTRIFYSRISDQKAFIEARIPAVMFTSGITMNSNKPTDTAKTLSYPILRRRVLLIYYFLANRL